MSLWSFLTGWGSTIGAAAYVTKEVGTAAKTQINFEVREQYRKKFFDEWVDEALEKKLRDDLSTPSKYDEIWERIEKYKEDEGEVYLMRKLFGEREGRRYFWEDVGKTRFQIRNKNGKCATGYTAKEYNNNYWKTMSLLMNTYEKLTADDAFYIFDICYNSITKQFGFEDMTIRFDKKNFRRCGKSALHVREYHSKWLCETNFLKKVSKETHLGFKEYLGYWYYKDTEREYDKIWGCIENYKKNGGELYSRIRNFLEKREEVIRSFERDGVKCPKHYEKSYLDRCGITYWEKVGSRRLPLCGRYGALLPEETYEKNSYVTYCLYINTFGKLESRQMECIEFDCRFLGFEF